MIRTILNTPTQSHSGCLILLPKAQLAYKHGELLIS